MHSFLSQAQRRGYSSVIMPKNSWKNPPNSKGWSIQSPTWDEKDTDQPVPPPGYECGKKLCTACKKTDLFLFRCGVCESEQTLDSEQLESPILTCLLCTLIFSDQAERTATCKICEFPSIFHRAQTISQTVIHPHHFDKPSNLKRSKVMNCLATYECPHEIWIYTCPSCYHLHAKSTEWFTESNTQCETCSFLFQDQKGARCANCSRIRGFEAKILTTESKSTPLTDSNSFTPVQKHEQEECIEEDDPRTYDEDDYDTVDDDEEWDGSNDAPG